MHLQLKEVDSLLQHVMSFSAQSQKLVCGTGDRAKAGEAFQKLQALDSASSASAKMLGQLARASAQGNPQQALALSSNLPPLPKLTGVSLDDLEAKLAGWSHSRYYIH